MVAKSFAELEFRCPDFLQALDAWAAGGVDSSTLEARDAPPPTPKERERERERERESE